MPHPVSQVCVHSCDSGASVSGNGCPRTRPPPSAPAPPPRQPRPTRPRPRSAPARTSRPGPTAQSARLCRLAAPSARCRAGVRRPGRGRRRAESSPCTRAISGSTAVSSATRSANWTRPAAGTGCGHPPAARRAVEQQPAEQQRHLRPDVIRRQQQDERPVPELRRQHDHRREQRPGPAPPVRRARPRASAKAASTSSVYVTAAATWMTPSPNGRTASTSDVLGQFGRVERHVAERPPVQQPVPGQHVPRLQRLRRPVRGGRHRPRHPQVPEEQQRPPTVAAAMRRPGAPAGAPCAAPARPRAGVGTRPRVGRREGMSAGVSTRPFGYRTSAPVATGSGVCSPSAPP